jgi:hypothetical protein
MTPANAESPRRAGRRGLPQGFMMLPETVLQRPRREPASRSVVILPVVSPPLPALGGRQE